ncbi:MAG: hypothetical protein VYB54_07640 [Pseudomonadota bacterium]|nr:hypothetical protein [Pseudomonadota bacterium]
MSRRKTTKQPWMKFYPGDWRSDPKLRMVSLAARGLWMDLLCLMHEAEPNGFIVVGDNRPTLEQLARLVGAEPQTIEPLLQELERSGAVTRTYFGALRCEGPRRTVLDPISDDPDGEFP